MALENIINRTISKAKNGLKNALFTAGLLGTLAFGGVREARAISPEYFENFTNPNSVNTWVVRDSSKFHHDTFEGDGVLKIEWDDNWGYAYYETARNENNPFILKWDSYLIPGQDLPPGYEFLFGIFIDYDRGMYYYYNHYAAPAIVVLEIRQGGISPDVGVEFNAANKWMHHILSYGPETNAEGNYLARLKGYLGKGIEAPESLAYDLQMYSPFSFYPDANKIGIPYVGPFIYGYIDNVYFRDIPEPATLGLVVAGGLAGLLAWKREQKF